MVHGHAIVVYRWRENVKTAEVLGTSPARRISTSSWYHRETTAFCSQMCVCSSPFICVTNVRILSEELSVWAGELDTLLLRWDDGWLPGLRWSSKEGAGEGLSGTRSWNPSSARKVHPKNKYTIYTDTLHNSKAF